MGSFIIKPRTRIVAANAFLAGAAAVVITTARLLAKRAAASASTAIAPSTRQSIDAVPAWLENAPVLQETFARAERSHLQSGTTTLAAVKSAAFAALAETPFILDSPTALAAEIRALEGATTLAAATAAKLELLAGATAIHARLQSDAILCATERAFLRAGLASIQRQPPIGSTRRIEGVADDGHVVVAEVGQDGTMATEILGACGSAQEALHDAIESALEAEGIRTSTKSRKPTGGVATTETAKEFLRRKVSAKQSDVDRTRRLNQQRAIARRR
jgi:hypothetical protein